jgi:hypothetical protein
MAGVIAEGLEAFSSAADPAERPPATTGAYTRRSPISGTRDPAAGPFCYA